MAKSTLTLVASVFIFLAFAALGSSAEASIRKAIAWLLEKSALSKKQKEEKVVNCLNIRVTRQ
jgi:hypothetical protein